MSRLRSLVAPLLLAGCLLSQLAITGCAARVAVGYRYHDAYRNDYHYWNDGERVYYSRWVIETNRPRHREFNRLDRQQQYEYWRWRHDHP